MLATDSFANLNLEVSRGNHTAEFFSCKASEFVSG
jgi:hypothetical protein